MPAPTKTPIPYAKPFLSLNAQVTHLVSKGLDCGPVSDAAQALHDIGYYRLSAYTYPTRKLLGPGDVRETEFQFRHDSFVPGASLAEAVALAHFDTALRQQVFSGLTSLEVALRFQIAHVLGRRNPFAHVEQSHLDSDACGAAPAGPYRRKYSTAFAHWIATYDSLIERARGEDYMRHIQEKYDQPIAIWVAIESFDFGALGRLYALAHRDDQNEIAKRFGVSDGRRFHRWITGLNVLRNHCAHHNRLWNRRLTTALAVIPPAIVGAEIHHLTEVEDRKKLYPWVTILAYILRRYDPSTNWPRSFRTTMRKFPRHSFVTTTQDMAFPSGWEALSLWADAPGSPRITTP